MKTLHLVLKAKWYSMIESGIKLEEYREIKPYWDVRLIDCNGNLINFDMVTFSYGYTRRHMAFRCAGIRVGKGRVEWGAPQNENVFIIALGERIF